MLEVKLPELGEGIEKATISYWYFEIGQKVDKDQDLVEMSTDKAVFNVPCPVAGTLAEKLFQDAQEVKVGQVLARLKEE